MPHLTPTAYSLVPFHQCSPRAGKLCLWAKSCQLQAFINKVLLESGPTQMFTLCGHSPAAQADTETETSALQVCSAYYRASFPKPPLLPYLHMLLLHVQLAALFCSLLPTSHLVLLTPKPMTYIKLQCAERWICQLPLEIRGSQSTRCSRHHPPG